MSNYLNELNAAMIRWMQANDFPESEINAIYIGADMDSVDDPHELAAGIGEKEAVLAEVGCFLNAYDSINEAALDYIPNNEASADLRTMAENGDEADAASAIHTVAENFVERN